MERGFRRHDAFRQDVVRIGRQGQPVLVIDNFLADAEALVDYAAQSRFAPIKGRFYPGVHAPAPAGYASAFSTLLGELVLQTFAPPGGRLQMIGSEFAIVTTRGEDLHRLQRLPHCDSTNPNYLAAIHYLCGPEHGGTCFFRHRETGAEFLNESLGAARSAVIERDIAKYGEPSPVHGEGHSAAYERIAAFDARLNRIIIYRGANLHSGRIPSDFQYLSDPRRGRLTLNTFMAISVPATP